MMLNSITANPELDSQCNVEYIKIFHSQPDYLVRAPGRVNIIGEHTDYNDGFVLPAAIDRFAQIALSPIDQARVILYSVNLDKKVEFDLDQIPRNGIGWEKYPIGIAGELKAAEKPLHGWQGVILSDVPIGGGLSSSAAVEMAYISAFAAVVEKKWEPREMALIGQRADKNWVGVSSGIMDQLISAAGVKNHALLIDCQSLELEQVRVPTGHAIVIMDTKTRRQLVDSSYNTLRKECEEAAKLLGGKTLRDVQEIEPEKINNLPLSLKKRVNHVISENRRVLSVVESMNNDDTKNVGELLYASHCSLRDEYQVSCEALDTIVDCAMDYSACVGARMTGAGFGGCALAMVEIDQVGNFIEHVTRKYENIMKLNPELFPIQVSDGATYHKL